MPVVFSALMCHAPIVHPLVGGPRTRKCTKTTRAMREIAQRTVLARPDRVVLVSPHSPRLPDAWSAWRGPHVGSLAAFDAPHVRINLPDAPEVWESLGLAETRGTTLDHGAVVPLAFLYEAGWRGPTAIVAEPRHERGAEVIGRGLAQLPGRTAVIASGDMSHRLKQEAPAGFHEHAADFDHAFVAALQRGDWDAALAAPWRREAAEDVVTSTAVALAAASSPQNAEVIAYEGPWGVGYTEAVFLDRNPPLYAIARSAVRAAAHGEPYAAPDGGPRAAGAFVTLTLDGELRGCMGHIFPIHQRLYQEVAEVARLAARMDPRYPAVTEDELDRLDLEVSVLSRPEAIDDPSALDPRRHGVIVSAGGRRGVLLPDLEGVDTPEEQVEIARRKARIFPHEHVALERFTVSRDHCP